MQLAESVFRVDGLCACQICREEAGFLFPGETHPEAELLFVLEGRLYAAVEGHSVPLESGQFILFGGGQWHMYYSDVGQAVTYLRIVFRCTGSLQPIAGLPFSDPGPLGQIVSEPEDRYSADLAAARVQLLLLLLLRRSGTPAENRSGEHIIIRRAQQYICTHARRKLSVPLVASQISVSPSYLTALFHKDLQISPAEYIRRVKLQESKQMIQENVLNFTEIAKALEYSTVHQFSRQFKEKFGITPTEYAKQARATEDAHGF